MKKKVTTPFKTSLIVIGALIVVGAIIFASLDQEIKFDLDKFLGTSQEVSQKSEALLAPLPPETVKFKYDSNSIINSSYDRGWNELGSDDVMRGGNANTNWRSVIVYDNIFGKNPGQIPLGSTITSANLILHASFLASQSGNTQITTYRVTDPSSNGIWDEDITNLTVRNLGNNWDSQGGDFDSGNGVTVPITIANQKYSWDVTQHVQQWSSGQPNQGWILYNIDPYTVTVNNDWAYFRTREYVGVSDRPLLNITYTIEEEFNIPSVSNLNINPGSVGLGGIINIDVDVDDDQQIYRVLAEIEYPDTSRINYTMIGLIPNFNLTFSDTNTQSGTYNVKIIAIDTSGNVNDLVTGSFIVGGDVIPPVLSNIQYNINPTTVDVTWNTDEPATSQVRWGTSSGVYTDSVSDPSLKTTHSLNFPVSFDTTYYFVINSSDAFGNQVQSTEQSFTSREFNNLEYVSFQYENGLLTSDTNYSIDAGWENGVNRGSDDALGIFDVGWRQAVYAYPNIIGNNPGQIPLGKSILSANFSVYMYSSSLPGQWPASINYYKIIDPSSNGIWEELVTTPDLRNTGNNWDSQGGDINISSTVNVPIQGIGNYLWGDVTSHVQDWSDGDPNQGWLVRTDEISPPAQAFIRTKEFNNGLTSARLVVLMGDEITGPDITPPSAGVPSFDPTSVGQGGDINISSIVNDDREMGTVLANVTYPDTSFNTFVMTGSEPNYNYIFTDTTQIGFYSVEIIANDLAGNTGISGSASFEVLDSMGPTVNNIIVDPAFTELGQLTTVSATVTDVSGVDVVNARINDNQGLEFPMVEVSASVYNYTFNGTQLGLDVGAHTFRIVANDTNGDLTVTASQGFNMEDTTIPQVNNLNDNPDPVEKGSNILLEADVIDYSTIADVTFEIDSSLFYIPTNQIGDTYQRTLGTAGLSIGSHTYRIIANDSSGNSNNLQSATFNIQDTTAPVVSNLIASPDPVSEISSLNLTAIITDNDGLDLGTTTFQIDGGAFEGTPTNIGGNVYRYTVLTAAVLGQGQHEFRVNAVDNQGNVNNLQAINFDVVSSSLDNDCSDGSCRITCDETNFDQAINDCNVRGTDCIINFDCQDIRIPLFTGDNDDQPSKQLTGNNILIDGENQNITFYYDGLVVCGPGVSGPAFAFMTGDDTSIRNLRLESFPEGLRLTDGALASGNSVINVEFENICDEAISSTQNGNNLLIQDSTFLNVLGGPSINWINGSGEIKNNFFDSGEGIVTGSGNYDLAISENSFLGGLNCNRAIRSSSTGLDVLNISNNEMNCKRNIQIRGNSEAYIYNNYIHDFDNQGINLIGSSKASIWNNTIVNGTVGSLPSGGVVLEDTSEADLGGGSLTIGGNLINSVGLNNISGNDNYDVRNLRVDSYVLKAENNIWDFNTVTDVTNNDVEGNVDVNPLFGQQACSVTGVSWRISGTEVTQAQDNSFVTMFIEGNNCESEPVTIEIWEQDEGLGGGDDNVTSLYSGLDTQFPAAGTNATSLWIADHTEDCGGLCNPPEYYFNAIVDGNTISSALLEVYLDDNPVVNLINPTESSNFVESSNINFQCNSTDGDGIQSIDLIYYKDGGVETTLFTSLNNISLDYDDNSLTTGNYLWNCRATDNLGNSNVNPVNRSFTISPFDPNAPQFNNEFVTPPSGSVYSPGQTYTFQVDVTDNEQVDTVWIEFDGTNYTAFPGAGDTYGGNFNNLGAGSYNYRWFANDSSGNIGSTSTNIYVLDKANSEVNLTLNSVSGNIFVNQGDSVNIRGELVTGANFGNLDVYINGIWNNTGGVPILDYNVIFNNIGNYEVLLNYSGNQNYTSSFENFSINVQDNLNPEVTNLNANPNPVEKGVGIDLSAMVIDPVNGAGGIDSVVIQVDGTSNYNAVNLPPFWGANVDTSGLSIGSHTYRIIANDSSGNVNDTQIGSFDVQDTTAPVVSNLIASPDPVLRGMPINLTATITDNDGLDLGTTSFLVGVFTFEPILIGGDTYTVELNATDVIGPGQHEFRVNAVDNQGNVNNTENITFEIVNAFDPTVFVLDPTEGEQVNGNSLNVYYGAYLHNISSKGEDHLHFYLDSDTTPYMVYNGNTNSVEYNGINATNVEWITNIQFRINNLAFGAHNITLVLADSTHTELTNPEARQTVNFEMIDNTSPPPSNGGGNSGGGSSGGGSSGGSSGSSSGGSSTDTPDVATNDILEASLELVSSRINVGGSLDVNIILRNLDPSIARTVDLLYTIKDSEGNVLYEEPETQSVGNTLPIQKRFDLSSIQEGEYSLFVDINYNSEKITTLEKNFVIASGISGDLATWLIVGIIGLYGLGFVGFSVYRFIKKPRSKAKYKFYGE